MSKCEFFWTSQLEKVFPDQRPSELTDAALHSFPGGRVAVQLVYRLNDACVGSSQTFYELSCPSAPLAFDLYQVELTASQYPIWPSDLDDPDYLRKTPGLFPDCLRPLRGGQFKLIPKHYRSLWISFSIPEDLTAKELEFDFQLTPLLRTDGLGQPLEQDANTVHLPLRLNVHTSLPPSRLRHTQWFHFDCLASHYNVPVFSEAHWQSIEAYLAFATKRCAMNMVLTPLWTPPLDTEVGSKRPCVQLVGIRELEEGRYDFDFSRLERWSELCHRYGIQFLELPHLFTQWGARFCPLFQIERGGQVKDDFAWDCEATSPRYRRLLEQLLPAVLTKLESLGWKREQLYFHLSDEPATEHLETYQAARQQVIDLIEGYPLIDALSHPDFFLQGLVQTPIPASDHIEDFQAPLDGKAVERWVYYCCCQGNLVPNRFFAMPLTRLRIMGVLSYLYRLDGFLHWGYNFYYSQLSKRLLNPFYESDCDLAFPSGDAYLVYPGSLGEVYPSLRSEITALSFVDYRLLCALESKLGREHVVNWLQEISDHSPFSFTCYPRSIDFFERLEQEGFALLA